MSDSNQTDTPGAGPQPDTFDRVVLLVGRTGNGKSTVANILYDGENLNGNFFPESCLGRGMTIRHKTAQVQIGPMRLTIIDTVGIGDPDLSPDQVCMELARAIDSCKGGIHQILLVTPGRLSPAEKEAFSLITNVLMNHDAVRHTTIVRSKFGAFQRDEVVQEDIRAIRGVRDSELYQQAAKIIHVDNPGPDDNPEWQHRRRVSRERLLTRIAACSELYQPPELQVIQQRVGEMMRKQRELEQAVEENKRLAAHVEEMKRQGNVNKELLLQLQQANAHRRAHCQHARGAGALGRRDAPADRGGQQEQKEGMVECVVM